MSFNQGFTGRSIDSISGSNGEVLTKVDGQWVSAPNLGSGGTFSGVVLDPTNPNLEGHGTALDPLKVKSSINLTSVTASFSGDGFHLTNLPLSNYATLVGVSGTFAVLNGNNTFTGNETVYGYISASAGLTGSAYGTRAEYTDITASNVTASDVITNYINFKHSVDPSWDNGRLWYNNATHELNYWTEVGTPNPFSVKLGQQLVQRCQNDQGTLLTKGSIVHITGSTSSDTPRIILADWTNDNLSANTLGLVAEDIATGGIGYVIVQGILKGINTNTYNPGQILFLSSSGQITSTKPTAPKHTVSIGQVIRSQLNNGSIYVSIQNGYELGELHDVSTNGKSNKDLLVWDSTIPAWKNSTSLGSYTFNGNQTITGSAYITTALSASQITGSFSGSAAGLTNLPSPAISFSPIDVGSSDQAPTAATTQFYYQTVAGATMTISKAKVWGFSGSSTVLFGVYRGTLSGTKTLIGQGSATCGVGPNEITLTAESGQTLNLVAGENIIVGLFPTGNTWQTVYRSGISDIAFGISNTSDIVTMPANPTGIASPIRFACTIY